MAVFENIKGINLASGFKFQSEAPLDGRLVVATTADRDALITEHGGYEGMPVYVKADKKLYVYNGTAWTAIETGGTAHTHANKTVLDAITAAFTTALKTNYDKAYTHSTTAHAPSGAQANVIETVKVNNTALVPASKAVNITVPTAVSGLTNDSKFQTETQVSAAIQKAISALSTTVFEVVETLPEYSAAKDNVLYLHKNTDTQNYDIYAKVSGVTDNLVWLDDVTADLSKYVKTETMTSELAKKAASTHTHPYAGSATAGGSATSAVKLDTTTAGTATQPVYFKDGKPVATTHQLNATVPTGAKFTDTTYVAATQSAPGLMSAADKKKLDNDVITGPYATTEEVTAAVQEILGA